MHRLGDLVHTCDRKRLGLTPSPIQTNVNEVKEAYQGLYGTFIRATYQRYNPSRQHRTEIVLWTNSTGTRKTVIQPVYRVVKTTI